MNKKIVILLSILCTVVILTGLFAGCNKTSVPDTDQTLEVFCWKGGYGSDWCRLALQAFEQQDWVKEKYPNLQTVFESDADRSAVNTRLSAGAGRNTLDLIFSDSVGPYMGKDRTGKEYSCNLTDVVYNTMVPGENITVYDKLLPSYKLSLMNYNVGESALDEKEFESYNFNWASGMRGILYNQEILASFGYDEAPRTSDELIEASAKISASTDEKGYNKGYAFMWSGEADYIGDMYLVWWAQYEGYEQYYNYYNGIFFDGRNYIEKSSKIFEQQGRGEALQTLIDVMNNDNGYMYPYGSSLKFKAAQKNFIAGDGVFMANGDWFGKEMEDDMADSKYTIRMMKTPVISSIIKKTPSISTDAQLRTVISRIDSGCETVEQAKAAPIQDGDADISAVTKADYQKIIEARAVVYSTGPDCDTCIPIYANGKEVAFDFLRFLATDIAQEIYLETTGGASLPFVYDVKEKNPQLYESFSAIQKDRYAMDFLAVYEPTVLPKTESFPLVKFGGLTDWSPFALNRNTIVTYARASGETGLAALNRDIDYWQQNNGKNWSAALTNAGLQ